MAFTIQQQVLKTISEVAYFQKKIHHRTWQCWFSRNLGVQYYLLADITQSSPT